MKKIKGLEEKAERGGTVDNLEKRRLRENLNIY